MHSLALFHRIAGRTVIVVGEGEAAAAKRRLIERAGGIPAGESADARLAFVACEERAEAETAAARLRERGILVNVADRPELCDFTLPSLLERGPVVIAVSTGGASAGLAKAIRLRLERLLPASLGPLAEALAAARERMRARWPDAGQRRRALDAALDEGGALDPFQETAPDALPMWLDSNADPHTSSQVEIVLRSDDPDDLTLREARWLGVADVVVAERGVPPAIFARARADAARLSPQDPIPSTGIVVRLRR
jgi:uroporphyrin-III C-methyltransferase/precorrin-2 dehydrogenase/sirohydrochlorin ferrochelatase